MARQDKRKRQGVSIYGEVKSYGKSLLARPMGELSTKLTERAKGKR